MTGALEMRYITILNPAAGGGRCGIDAPAALDELRKSGLQLEVHPTEGPGDAMQIAQTAYRRGERRFLAVGGDGTNFEIINGLFAARGPGADPLTLGMLPLGTGNSMLRDFDIHDWQTAAQSLVRGQTRGVDVVEVEHAAGRMYYLNLLSIGFSARAGQLTNQRFKRLGRAGYVLAVLSCVGRLKHYSFPIQLDEGTTDHRPCVLLSFSNSRYTGGRMMMAPEADCGDGKLDVIRVGPLGRWSLLKTFPRIFGGRHVRHPLVEQTKATQVLLPAAKAADVMVDGEVLELEVHRVRVLPQAIEVLA